MKCVYILNILTGFNDNLDNLRFIDNHTVEYDHTKIETVFVYVSYA